jgi:ubiquitin-conjugating enzyme E2 Q
MSLSVPPVASTVTQLMGSAHQHHQQQGESRTDAGQDISDKLVTVKYDLNRQEVIFEDGKSCPVRNGDWIVITPAGKFKFAHTVLLISQAINCHLLILL